MPILVAIIAGAGGLAAIRLLESGQQARYLLLAWPAIVMLTYAGLELRRRHREEGWREAVADNCYYLGFVLTLCSVSLSLASAAAPSRNLDGLIDQVVAGFGIAMSSTILGVTLRVVLSQPTATTAERQDAPLDQVVAEARRTADAARELGEAVVRNLRKFDSELSDAIEARIAAAGQAAEAGMVRRADAVAERFDVALGEVAHKMATLNAEHSTRAHAAVTEEARGALQRLDETLAAVRTRMEDGAAALHSRLTEASTALAAGTERAASVQAERTQLAFEALETRAESVMQQLARDHAKMAQGALSGLAAEAEAARREITAAFGALPGQLAEITTTLSRQVGASTEQMTRGAETALAAQLGSAERATQHIERLAAQIGAIEATLSRRLGEVGTLLSDRMAEFDRAAASIDTKGRQAAEHLGSALDAVAGDLRQKAASLSAHVDLVAAASARGTTVATAESALLREAVLTLAQAIQGGAAGFSDARVQIDAIAHETEGARVKLRDVVLEADKVAGRLRDGVLDVRRV